VNKNHEQSPDMVTLKRLSGSIEENSFTKRFLTSKTTFYVNIFENHIRFDKVQCFIVFLFSHLPYKSGTICFFFRGLQTSELFACKTWLLIQVITAMFVLDITAKYETVAYNKAQHMHRILSIFMTSKGLQP
jgi:hypothetical protein